MLATDPFDVYGPLPLRQSLRHGIVRRGGEGAAQQQAEVLHHVEHDADLVAVLKVLADAGQVDADRDAVLLELGARTDAAQLEQLRRVEGAGRQDDLAARERLHRRAALGRAGVEVGLVQVRAVEELDADGARAARLVRLVGEEHARDQRAGADGEREALGHGGGDALAGAVARAAARGQREAEHALGVAAAQLLVDVALDEVEDLVDVLEDVERVQIRPAVPLVDQLDDGGHDGADEADVAQRQGRVRLLDAQPLAHAVVVAIHLRRRPGRVAGHRRDAVPVALLGQDGDHRVDRGRSAQRAAARVEDALRRDLCVALLARRIGVVIDEVPPGQPRILGQLRVEDRDLVVLRVAGVVAGLEQQDARAGASQPGGQRPAARARADDDVVEVGRLGAVAEVVALAAGAARLRGVVAVCVLHGAAGRCDRAGE